MSIRTSVLLLLLGLLWFVMPGGTRAAIRVNLRGSPIGTTITVSSVAVKVVDQNPQRLYVVIQNTSVNAMNCLAQNQGVPTSTIGIPIPGNQQIRFDKEGYEAFACIRSTGADATAVVIEGLP